MATNKEAMQNAAKRIAEKWATTFGNVEPMTAEIIALIEVEQLAAFAGGWDAAMQSVVNFAMEQKTNV